MGSLADGGGAQGFLIVVLLNSDHRCLVFLLEGTCGARCHPRCGV